VLIGFMYRLATGFRPRFAAPLLGWHAHGGRSQMTHVWLTGSLRTALANCMPVEALQAAILRYRFDPAGRPGSPESIPCPAAASAAANRSVRVGDNWFVRRRGVPTVTVRRGDRVTWRFTGREPHNVVSQGGPARFGSPTRRSGTYARRMTRSGTYTIVCTIHGGRDQRMRLVVR
jgi:plastocyanin